MQINGERIMTVKEALEMGASILKEAYRSRPAENVGLIDADSKTACAPEPCGSNPVSEAGILLCEALNKDRVYIYSHGDDILECGTKERYLGMLHDRAQYKPLQYITGHQEFMSLDFEVTPDVLIPRQDTEILVETVIEHAVKMAHKPLKILELGTGSGCISVSLAHFLQGCLVTAIDISQRALEVAARNALKAGVAQRITFIKEDMSCLLRRRASECGLFDIIVSNPPYIPTLGIERLEREVREFEPMAALNGGLDGLDFYRIIIEGSIFHLKKGGLLALEVGIDQAEHVARLMCPAYGYICRVKDLAGIDRVVCGVPDGLQIP